MARVTSQEAIKAVGGDQFLVVLMAAQRAREISRGSAPRVEAGKNTPAVIAIREIEEKKYTKEEFYSTLRGQE
jgi:DNA-directed RNA polymerase subunit omega